MYCVYLNPRVRSLPRCMLNPFDRRLGAVLFGRLILALVLVLSASLSRAQLATVTQNTYVYDARMSFINAGELRLQLERAGAEYAVNGEFKTSRLMSRYYSWNGIFAAVGKWEGDGPVTRAYMSRTISSDEDLKIVLLYEDSVRVLEEAGGDFESVEKPGGIDLISALFFSPDCYEGGEVHDGEDTYRIELRRERERTISGGRGYYSGPVVSCDYRVVDHKDRRRRVIVSLAEIEGRQVAVQVRAKIPVLPDAVFKLKGEFK